MAEGGGFVVALYKFEKYNKSTKTPPQGYPYIQGWGFVKDEFNIINPVVRFDFGTLTDNTSYNYARIPEFNDRYYFIRNWRWYQGSWFIEMEVDPLATYRHEIWNCEQYMLRSAYASDGRIVDLLYPGKAKVTLTGTEIANFFEYQYSEGTYVLGCIGNSPGNTGAVTYYCLDSGSMNLFLSYLLSNTVNWAKLPQYIEKRVSGDLTLDIEEDIDKQLFKAQVNPLQYIASAMWLPYSPSTSGASGSIKLGYWDIPVGGASILSGGLTFKSASIHVNKHPQAASRGTYLNGAPFSRYTLLAGNFGQFAIDASCLIDAESLDLDIVCDPITGAGHLYLSVASHTAGWRILSTSAMLGVPITLAQISKDFVASTMAIGQVIGSIGDAFKLDFGGAISGSISALGNFYNSLAPQLNISGSAGSPASLRQPFALEAEFVELVEEDNEHRGRPLCQKGVLKHYPGYILCADADVDFMCTKEEKDMITNAMNTGMFIEYDVFPED